VASKGAAVLAGTRCDGATASNQEGGVVLEDPWLTRSTQVWSERAEEAIRRRHGRRRAAAEADGKSSPAAIGLHWLDYFSRETLEDEAEPMECSPGLRMAGDGRAQCRL
jgi:hypothetical protein